MATYHDYIRFAVERGFDFDFEEQKLVCPSGYKITPRLYGSQRYPSYTINLLQGDKSSGSFPIHKFAAYLLYGEKSLEKGVHVRHIDGDVLNLSKENIVLGTARENEMDKDPSVRSRSAKAARKAQGSRPCNAIITDQQAEYAIREYLKAKGDLARAPRGTVKKLAEHLGLNREAVSSACLGINFKHVYNRIMEEINNV